MTKYVIDGSLGVKECSVKNKFIMKYELQPTAQRDPRLPTVSKTEITTLSAGVFIVLGRRCGMCMRLTPGEAPSRMEFALVATRLSLKARKAESDTQGFVGDRHIQ